MATEQKLTTTHPPGECAVCRRCSPPFTKARAGLLDRVRRANERDLYPSKADLTRDLPARTRANHYLMLGELEHAGLIVDTSGFRAGAFAYEITWTGRYFLDELSA